MVGYEEGEEVVLTSPAFPAIRISLGRLVNIIYIYIYIDIDIDIDI